MPHSDRFNLEGVASALASLLLLGAAHELHSLQHSAGRDLFQPVSRQINVMRGGVQAAMIQWTLARKSQWIC